MNLKELIEKRIRGNIKVSKNLIRLRESVKKCAEMISKALENDGRVFIFGNGGSAADAQHIAAELVGKYYLERKALPAMALTTNSSTITAVANDIDFENVFSRQIEAFGKKKDVAIGISTSGESENVIQGLKRARELGLKTIGFTGRSGGRVKEIVDLCLSAPSDDTPRIQEAHITLGHIICEIVEENIFGGENGK